MKIVHPLITNIVIEHELHDWSLMAPRGDGSLDKLLKMAVGAK